MSDEVPNPYNPAGKKITFYNALNNLMSLSNLDIYVTDSNSKCATTSTSVGMMTAAFSILMLSTSCWKVHWFESL